MSATFAPSFANATAVARPIPRPAPVTRTTPFFRSMKPSFRASNLTELLGRAQEIAAPPSALEFRDVRRRRGPPLRPRAAERGDVRPRPRHRAGLVRVHRRLDGDAHD